MFRNNRSPFVAIESEDVLGSEENPANFSDLDPGRYIRMIGRLLGTADTSYVKQHLPRWSEEFILNRRRLLFLCTAELSHDLDLLWTAKRAMAEVKEIDFAALVRWRIETNLLVGQLKMLTFLHGRAQLRKRAVGLVAKIENIITTTMNEVGGLLPETEALP